MREIKAVIQSHRLDHVLKALHGVGNLPSMSFQMHASPTWFRGSKRYA